MLLWLYNYERFMVVPVVDKGGVVYDCLCWWLLVKLNAWGRSHSTFGGVCDEGRLHPRDKMCAGSGRHLAYCCMP
jgi:hypothetical protein